MTGQISFKVVTHCIYHSLHLLTSLNLSFFFLETGGIEKVLAITDAEVEPSSPCKLSSPKSGAFSLSGKSSFSHGTLIGSLPVAIATVRRCFLQKVAVLSYPGLKRRWLQMVINISSTYYPVVK